MVKQTLFIGAMQSGKTTHVVSKACQNQTTVQIPAFCNYNSTLSMESTNEKIEQYDISLIAGLNNLRTFKYRAHRGKLNPDEKYVLSFLQHNKSLEEVRNIATSFDPKYYNVYSILPIFDEDDVLAFGHKQQKVNVQKRREAHAMLAGLPLVEESWHVSATPFAQQFSNISFDDVVKIKPGENYKTIQQIVDNLKEMWTEEDIESLTTEPTRKMISYIQDENYTGVDLIQTSSKIDEQYAIVDNLVKYTENSIIAVANSGGKPSYYFSDGTTYGTSDENFNKETLYRLAIENDIKRVFIVAYFLSDRTNTFRAPLGIFNEMRSILNASAKTGTDTILQRAGRLCGYQDSIPLLTCTSKTADALYRAVEDFEVIEQMPLDIMASCTSRYEFLEDNSLNLHYLRDTNGFKTRKAGQWYSVEKSKGVCLSELFTGKLNEDIDIEDTNFNSNRALKEYFMKKYDVQTVLNCNDTKNIKLLRPNTETEIQKHRELGVKFLEDRKYMCIKQDFNVYPENKKYCMHNFEGTYDYHPNTNGVSQ